MSKKIFVLAFVVVFSVLLSFSAFAQSDIPRLIDEAGVLDDTQKADLTMQLDQISESEQFDLAVIIVNDYDGKSAQQFADDYYNYYNFGYGDNKDGSLLLIGIEEDKRHISTSGYGLTVFNVDCINYIGSQIGPYLDEGDYYSAINGYIDLCDDCIAMADSGTPYYSEDSENTGFPFFKSLLICLVIGFVVALIVVLIMKSQLKSVRRNDTAAEYIRQGSMVVTESRDLFLYRNVTKVKKAENNSSKSGAHISSSGRTHGGGSF